MGGIPRQNSCSCGKNTQGVRACKIFTRGAGSASRQLSGGGPSKKLTIALEYPIAYPLAWIWCSECVSLETDKKKGIESYAVGKS